jgi:hypothetical protein
VIRFLAVALARAIGHRRFGFLVRQLPGFAASGTTATLSTRRAFCASLVRRRGSISALRGLRRCRLLDLFGCQRQGDKHQCRSDETSLYKSMHIQIDLSISFAPSRPRLSSNRLEV